MFDLLLENFTILANKLLGVEERSVHVLLRGDLRASWVLPGSFTVWFLHVNHLLVVIRIREIVC